jgi:MarR family 2-MHQ and catechol resistance regulon transcriptional repressor
MHVVLRIFQTAQMLDKAAQRVFSPHGLTAAQFNVLNLLSDQEKGLRASELAASLIVDPSNVTGLLKRMSRDGLVTDLENKADRRQRIVALTPKGRALWTKACRDYNKCLKALDAELTAKDKMSTEAVLIALSKAADKLSV